MGANRINFKTYINNGTFFIPLYQRDFVWRKDQATRFLNEIIELHEDSFDSDDDRKIFCGSTYLKSNVENNWDIIDGQQRTTFLYGLKWALFDRMNELIKDLSDIESKTTKKTLENFKDLHNSISSFQIKTAKSKNDDSFENQLSKNKGSIIKVFNEIKQRLDEYIEDENKLNNVKIDVIDFIMFIFTKVELIEVKVEENDDINDIFKSINSKGKALGTWDIIRNDIYRKSNAGEDLLQNIDDNLDEIDNDYYIKKEEFIQGYLMHKMSEYVSKSKMLKKFDEFSNNNNPETIKSDIESFIKKMKSFDKDKNTNGINFIKYFFKMTREFKFTQIRTFSLAAIMSWEIENEVPVQLKKLLINAVIYISISGGRGNEFEKFFMKKAKEILSNQAKLSELIENEAFYKSNVKTISDNKIAEKIDDNHSMLKLLIWLETPNSEFGKIIHSLNFEYEHVLPRANSKWKEEYDYWENVTNSDITEKYLDKLGNIILIHKKLNSKISNSIFSEKVKWYLENEVDGIVNSHYIFTRNLSLDKDLDFLKGIYDISKELKWDGELITSRTEKVTNLIINSISENF